MNREDIIRMARDARTPESPFGGPKWGVPSWSFDADELERFFQAAYAAGAAAEREACAHLVENMQQAAHRGEGVDGWEAAYAIRARGASNE